MKTAAVICELNPFHNGHAYLFRALREEYGADRIVALMSGNFVQRGEPAILDKYTRARMALLCGADLVLEMPTVFSTASAREFASAGVQTALAAGVVDLLGFGTEGSITAAALKSQAEQLDAAGDPARAGRIRDALRSGRSYPAAVSAAADPFVLSGAADESTASADAASSAACLSGNGTSGAGALTMPNNILAAEYLRALDHFDPAHRIEPAGIGRVGDAYASTEASDAVFCSAGALRRMLLSEAASSGSAGMPPRFLSYVPAELHELYRDILSSSAKGAPSASRQNVLSASGTGSARLMTPDSLSGLLNKALLDAVYRGTELSVFADVSSEIANRLKSRADIPMSFTERIRDTKTRQYTYTRISRALLHIALGLTREEFEAARNGGSYDLQSAGTAAAADKRAAGPAGQAVAAAASLRYVSYLRILGFRRDAADLMKALKEHSSVPIITKTADHKELLKNQLFYDQLYNSISCGCNEFEHSPVIL